MARDGVLAMFAEPVPAAYSTAMTSLQTMDMQTTPPTGRTRVGELDLRVLPPRAPQVFLNRDHLALDRFRQAGMQVIELCAPHGFGKTTQLTEWHREAVLSGETAIWLSLGERDDSSRLIQGLTNAALRVSRRDFFSASFAEWIGSCALPSQALTAWMYEVAQSHQNTLLLLDDVDRLPADARSEVLDYLLANAPSNLRIALSTLPNATVDKSDIFGSTPMMRITAQELRFRLAETAELVDRSLNQSLPADLGVRIHALTGGWPLGVRLGIASQLRTGNQAGPDVSIAADIGRYFKERVIEPLPQALVSLLVGMARFDPIHAELCGYALGCDDPSHHLARLADESPILTRSENGEWLRMHDAAREVLVEMQDAISAPDRRQIAERACAWYAQQGLYEAGAAQATLVGDREEALRLIELSLREMTSQGRNSEVLEWFDRMSRDTFLERPSFWPATAWALAMSDRAKEARNLVSMIVDRPESGESERFEANLILGAICSYQDDFVGLEDIQHSSPGAPSTAQPGELLIRAICKASIALMNGQTEQVRMILSQAASAPVTGASANTTPVSVFTSGFAATIFALSYLWEGKPQLAYDLLVAEQARVETALDRWSRIVSMIAVCLAQACLETGRIEEAGRHLALRLPIVEKQALPDVVIAAHLLKAELYEIEGRQDRAADQLASLDAIGRSRNIVRMSAIATAEAVQLHARHGRIEVAETQLKRLEAMILDHADAVSRSVQQWLDVQLNLARAALYAQDQSDARLQAGADAAARAIALASQLNRGRDHIRAKFLHSVCLERLGNRAAANERAEAISMCNAAGFKRLLEMNLAVPAETGPPQSSLKVQRTAPPPEAPVRSILTPREMEILQLLTDHLSNKEIALAMGLGEETVKWHLKNLFQKLETSSRRIAIVRARLLGII